jgi:hypothetical protein
MYNYNIKVYNNYNVHNVVVNNYNDTGTINIITIITIMIKVL